MCDQVQQKLKGNMRTNLNKPIESEAGSTISSGAGPGIADGLNYTSNKFGKENLIQKYGEETDVKTVGNE